MLTSTFCHIPGIADKTERALWSAGVTSWHSAWSQLGVKMRRDVLTCWAQHMEESIRNHANRNLIYFAESLPPNQHWRLYYDFREICAFVDIETTGLSSYDEITTAVLYDGRSIRWYVNGIDLAEFPKAIADYSLLVMYSGKCFDLPRIRQFFNTQLPHAHIDLRYPLASLGIKGGLKECERQLGIARPGLAEVDGSDAVLLWKEYRQRKNIKALETLLAYNIRDTLSLHLLMVHTHNEMLKTTPFASRYTLPVPSLPEPPFQADRDIVERLRRQAFPPTVIRPVLTPASG